MRTTSLATALALLLVGCGLESDLNAPDDAGLSDPDPTTLQAPEPLSPAEPTAGHAADALTGDRPWADGYVWASDPTSASYTPLASRAYNRAGKAIRITRPSGTTGRYVVTFTGLSAVLGFGSAVRATGFGTNNSYCKPVLPYLENDKVEVRCFAGVTGTPVNSRFTLLVSRSADDRAFVFANQPTATEYRPEPKGSYNPDGGITVKRLKLGSYLVSFEGFRSRFPTTGGHPQVNAVGTGKAHCTISEWGGSQLEGELLVLVGCYTPAGAPVDSKFSVLFAMPSRHLAYAFGDQPSATSYTPDSDYSSNPAGGGVSITRNAKGKYTIWWTGVDSAILGGGNVQVSAALDDIQCKVSGQDVEKALVQCFAPNGTLVDGYYTVLLGS